MKKFTAEDIVDTLSSLNKVIITPRVRIYLVKAQSSIVTMTKELLYRYSGHGQRPWSKLGSLNVQNCDTLQGKNFDHLYESSNRS